VIVGEQIIDPGRRRCSAIMATACRGCRRREALETSASRNLTWSSRHPDGKPFQLARHLGAEAARPAPRVVFLTAACVETEARALARACGDPSSSSSPPTRGAARGRQWPHFPDRRRRRQSHPRAELCRDVFALDGRQLNQRVRSWSGSTSSWTSAPPSAPSSSKLRGPPWNRK